MVDRVRTRLRAIIRNDKQFIQWFILSELQACPTMTHYQTRKAELYDYIRHRFIERKAIYYAIFLLEEARRDEKSGIVRFSDKVKRLPDFPRPKQRTKFKILTNKNWHRGDDLKI